jgi:hypothetical protein
VSASGLAATHVTHDDDNLSAAGTSASAAFDPSEGSTRMDELLGTRDQPESRSGSPRAQVGTGRGRPFPTPLSSLRLSSSAALRSVFPRRNRTLLAKSNRRRRYAPRVFGFIPECHSASLREQRSARRNPHSYSRYVSSRIEGVKVIPTNNPSGAMKRLTVWPHGSRLFFTNMRCPCDSSSSVALSTLSTSNSSQACGGGISRGQQSLPKQDCAACESGQRAKVCWFCVKWSAGALR